MFDDRPRGSWADRLQGVETAAAVDRVHRSAVEKRLTAIEDTLKWLVRLVIGAVITIAIAFLMKGAQGI